MFFVKHEYDNDTYIVSPMNVKSEEDIRILTREQVVAEADNIYGVTSNGKIRVFSSLADLIKFDLAKRKLQCNSFDMDIHISDDAVTLLSLSKIYSPKVVLPEYITNIHGSAFYATEVLTDKEVSLYLPESIITVGEHLFCDKAIFTHIEWGCSVTILTNRMFSYCGARSINFKSSPKEIEAFAFHAAEVESITFSDGLKKVGAEVFSRCKNLKELVFPKSLEELSFSTLMNIEPIKMYLPDSVKLYENKQLRAFSSYLAQYSEYFYKNPTISLSEYTLNFYTKETEQQEMIIGRKIHEEIMEKAKFYPDTVIIRKE